MRERLISIMSALDKVETHGQRSMQYLLYAIQEVAALADEVEKESATRADSDI